jgi:UDP-N-acetylglucosamine 2-epimerase
MKKTVVTISGIRPDFIRMSEIYKKLDKHFNHILIHTGQHYDAMLSEVFFKELEIRSPDYNLCIGGHQKEHHQQLADVSVNVITLLRNENIKPDIILFLGDSNSAGVAFPLAKEGYRIGHIEAGMRSYDKRMLEELNRTVCDHCSNVLFVYHEDYKDQLLKENILEDNIHVVGNTIVEVCREMAADIISEPKLNKQIILDIHRPENFKYKNRLENIIKFAIICGNRYNLPVKMLGFNRTMQYIEQFNINLGSIKVVPLMSYKEYLYNQYHSKFIISDSGTAQEEPALLKTPVVVPRDFTERPQSYDHNCSVYLCTNQIYQFSFDKLDSLNIDASWLGDGKTSDRIISILKGIL